MSAGCEAATVCIAAHNEAHGIETALRSALAQEGAGVLQVLVCANACSDATAEIVRRIACEDARVRLFETAVSGKPNAWNLLRERARGAVLYFMDADVYALPGAFESLARALAEEPRLVAAGARCIPVNLHRDPLTRLTAPPSGPISCLNGGLYAVDSVRLARRLRERGFARMPHDVICEDLWLTLAIGRERWAEVPRARALYVLSSFRERIRTEGRNRWGLRQLRHEYRPLHREFRVSYTARLKAIASRAAREGSLPSTLRLLSGTLFFRSMVLCTMGVDRHGAWLRKWRAAPKSKRMVPLLADCADRFELSPCDPRPMLR